MQGMCKCSFGIFKLNLQRDFIFTHTISLYVFYLILILNLLSHTCIKIHHTIELIGERVSPNKNTNNYEKKNLILLLMEEFFYYTGSGHRNTYMCHSGPLNGKDDRVKLQRSVWVLK